MKVLMGLWHSVYRHPLKTLQYAFTSFSIIFTLINAITHCMPHIQIEGPNALVILISVGFGC